MKPPVRRPVDGEVESASMGNQANCIPNISYEERRKRLWIGVVILAAGAVLWLALLWLDVDSLWRLAVFPLFAGGATSIFQWRDKT